MNHSNLSDSGQPSMVFKSGEAGTSARVNMAGFASLVNLKEEGCPVTRGRRIQISQMGGASAAPEISKASKTYYEEHPSGNIVRKRWSFHTADQVTGILKEDKSMKPILSPKRRKASSSTEIANAHKGPLAIVVDGKQPPPLPGPSSKHSQNLSTGSRHLLASQQQQQSQHRHSHRHHHQRRSSSGKVLSTKTDNEKGSSSSTLKQLYLKDYYAMHFDESNLPSSYHQFRMRKNNLIREPPPDLISGMPDEILLRVCKFLPKSALANLGRTSHRFLGLIEDETLWKRLCVASRMLNPEHLLVIMRRRPMYLRMARTQIPDPEEFPDPSELASSSQLTYLDLTSAMISPQTLALFMRISPKIIKLSLEHLEVTKDVLESMMQMAVKMEELNITMCYDIDPATFSRFLARCQNLKQLNMGCLYAAHWSKEDLTIIFQNLPSTIEQLNVSGFRNILDNDHVAIIVTRCPSLVELDLSDSSELQARSIALILELQFLQHLSLSRCYGIEPTAYTLLAGHKTLKYLDLFSLFKENSLRQLSSNLPGKEVNKFYFSAIARPTVGNKRSSIWLQRVRD